MGSLLPELPIREPQIWRGMDLPGPQILDIVQRVALEHFADGGGEESELSTAHFPICASPGNVRPHTDDFDGAETGKLIFGLVLRSDSHMLHTASMPLGTGIPLMQGDLYAIHPRDRHWTAAPWGAQLIFAAAFIGPDDPRWGQPARIAHDLRWETIRASHEFEVKHQKLADMIKITYAGVEPVCRK